MRNVERWERLTDAGLSLLATDGARGLTHRAVDREAHVPDGTTSNYFRTRDELTEALAHRIFERLAPESMEPDQSRNPSRETVIDYVGDIVRRVLGAPQLTIALLELRLEATRRPALVTSLRETLSRNYQADIAFHFHAGLPGGPFEIMLLHFAINGLILDRLTTGIGPDDEEGIDHVVQEIVLRIIPEPVNQCD